MALLTSLGTIKNRYPLIDLNNVDDKKTLVITFDVQLNPNMRNMEDLSRTNATFSPASVFLAHILSLVPQ